MAQATTDKKKPEPVHHGIPSSPEELAESQKAWQDMDDCFSLLDKRGSKKSH